MRSAWIAVAVALAACKQAKPAATAGYRGPTAAAPFVGIASAHPGTPYPYLAVANGRNDDLRIVDPSGDQALYSPGYAFPLSIPVLPSPRYLASASLGDGQADLLAVAGVGSVVQIVDTWEAESRVASSWDLTTDASGNDLAGAGAEILSMVAVPYPGAPAGSPPVAPVQPGRSLLLVGFSGSVSGPGKLVVVELDRATDGKAIVPVGAAANPLGFDPVSLSVSPDGFHVYAATPDVITDFTSWPPPSGARQVQGVAEIDMSAGPPGAWTVRGLDSRAPTTLVAAAILGERQPDAPNQFGARVPRVYAALDQSACGVRKPIACGIAVLDPALGGLAADPAPPGAIVPAQSYRTPLSVPGTPMALAVAMPSASGPLQCLDDCPPDEVPQAPVKQPLMRFAPESGSRWTTATAVVATADGQAWMYDLGTYAAGNRVAMLPVPVAGQPLPSPRLQVASAESRTPRLSDGSQATAGLGLYLLYPGANQTAGLTSDSNIMPGAVMVWPGFTPDDIWYITWQGQLPGLANQAAAMGLDASGGLWLAFQSNFMTEWIEVGKPELGIELGDVGQFLPDPSQFPGGVDPCAVASPSGAPHEAPIASILPPSSQYPGGAVLLPVPTSPSSDPFNLGCLASYLAAPPPGSPSVLTGTGNVRASGLVLYGTVTGYAGRPPMLTATDVATGTSAIESKRYDFAWADESTLTGEALVLARKARRFYYPPTACYPGRCVAYPWLSGNPLVPGPALAFVVGPQCLDEPPGSGLRAICPTARLGELQRDSFIVTSTQSGLLPASRRPTPISLPTWAVAFDKSQFPGDEGLGSVFYVTYQLDSVLMMVPGQSLSSSRTLR